jgi:hypothetical protein
MEKPPKIPELKTNPEDQTQEDLMDHYWYLITYIHGLIKASELKAGLILSFYGIVLNLYFQYIDELLTTSQYDWIVILFLAGWFLLTMISMYYSFRCFLPLILNKYNKNVFFFGDVISSFGSIEEYAQKLYQVSNNRKTLFSQLGEQVYINSKIAATKFGFVNKSVRFLAINIILLLLFSIIYSIRVFL